MKKQVFTFLIMLSLVAITGKVFGQGSTPMAPYNGATHTYVVNGLTDGDTYSFGINKSSAGFSHEGSVDYSATGTLDPVTATVSGNTASLEVTWNVGAGSGPYYVWIRIQDSEGCYTYRALPVTPVNAPPAYTVDFTVIAFDGTGDETTTAGALTGGSYAVAVSDVCPSFIGEDWVLDALNDASTTDGSTYVYFRVNRYSTQASGWNITPATSGASTWEVSTDASSWSTMNATQSVASGNVLYVRATVDNSTSQQVVSFDIQNTGQDAGGIETDANTSGIGSDSNSASVTLDPLPEVGTFSDSY
jgi:hypothetical protein